MNIYLLRHGEAEHQASSDANRELSAYGRKEVADVARLFALKNLPLDRCIASPYSRAQQTAALFTAALTKPPLVETAMTLTPESRPIEVLNLLEGLHAENVLLVSHNPLLSELVALLDQGGLHKMKIVSTGELNAFAIDIIGVGTGEIQFSLSPFSDD